MACAYKKTRCRRRNKNRKSTISIYIFILIILTALHYNFDKKLDLNVVVKTAGVLLILIILFATVKHISKSIDNNRERKRYLNCGIYVVDKMQGEQFEHFLLAHYQELGYKGRVTNASNDYGADLYIKKGKERIIIQAKRYNSKVGIKAIQELVGALKYYDATRGMVITNSYFTKNAISLAKANGVELINRNGLTKLMNKNKTLKLKNRR